jgi:hypothetical protein
MSNVQVFGLRFNYPQKGKNGAFCFADSKIPSPQKNLFPHNFWCLYLYSLPLQTF